VRQITDRSLRRLRQMAAEAELNGQRGPAHAAAVPSAARTGSPAAARTPKTRGAPAAEHKVTAAAVRAAASRSKAA